MTSGKGATGRGSTRTERARSGTTKTSKRTARRAKPAERTRKTGPAKSGKSPRAAAAKASKATKGAGKHVTAAKSTRKKVEQLEATNNDMANLLASADTPTLLLAPDRTIKRFTAAATRLFRLIPSDLGRPVGDITWKFTDPEFHADTQAVLRTLAPNESEVQGEDGRWYLRRITPYRTADEHIEGAVVTFTDITAAKHAQEILRDSNLELERRVEERTAELAHDRNFMSAILDNAPALIVVLDTDARIVQCNKACETLSCRDPKQVLGRSIFDVGLIPAKDAPSVRNAFRRLRSGESPVNFECLWQPGRGEARSIMWRYTRLPDSGGAFEFMVGMGVDVTDQRRAQEEARLHQNALLHAHRTTTAGELSGALAHEISQPLSSIANLCEASLQKLASKSADAAKVTANLHAIAKQAQRAGRVIDDLRGFIARREIKRERVDINDVVKAACDLIAPEANAHGVRVQIDLDDGPLAANVAAIHIEHTLINLMQNAIDAIIRDRVSDGVVRVTTRRADDADIVVRVSDNGSGFGIDVPEQAFEPFYTTKNDGLGLGLAIARSVIEANGGSLVLETDGDEGATMRIDLPGRS